MLKKQFRAKSIYKNNNNKINNNFLLLIWEKAVMLKIYVYSVKKLKKPNSYGFFGHVLHMLSLPS